VQNAFLIVASYFFYGWWDWRFLSLIIFSSLVDFTIGIRLDKTEDTNKRKGIIFFSLLVNLGLLGFFKYYNFFTDSLISAFSVFGIHLSARSLNVILPIGISFYTFQSLSYTLLVYQKKLKATYDIVTFMAYVCFFPQLVAGPIERATRLLPQFLKSREFDFEKAKDGLRQILWGLFKKIVIADNVAVYVNEIFEGSNHLRGSALLLGAVYFAFQIYADFSGYSDIAIGTARLFGVNLMRNFAYPYFSVDIGEFWRRWHISLSSWFRDFLFLPLAWSFNRKLKKPRYLGIKAETWIYALAIITTWFLVGLWHGANWTFVTWGVLHGLFLLLFHVQKKQRQKLFRFLHVNPKWKALLFTEIIFTFFITLIAWIFFRSETMHQAFGILGSIFSAGLFSIPGRINYLPLIIILLIVEWIQRDKQHVLQIEGLKLPYRWAVYYLVIFVTIFAGNFNQSEFIYFQF
jgi:D-alanyl-lipoteichoic acid acyltransferase DltB (MBOAT superfamily)